VCLHFGLKYNTSKVQASKTARGAHHFVGIVNADKELTVYLYSYPHPGPRIMRPPRNPS